MQALARGLHQSTARGLRSRSGSAGRWVRRGSKPAPLVGATTSETCRGSTTRATAARARARRVTAEWHLLPSTAIEIRTCWADPPPSMLETTAVPPPPTTNVTYSYPKEAGRFGLTLKTACSAIDVLLTFIHAVGLGTFTVGRGPLRSTPLPAAPSLTPSRARATRAIWRGATLSHGGR